MDNWEYALEGSTPLINNLEIKSLQNDGEYDKLLETLEILINLLKLKYGR